MKSTVVTAAHGAGGRASRTLLDDVFLPAFGDHGQDDGAAFGENMVLSTDAYVVSPLFFPGGCIGDLAVNGTCNDLAVMGASPVALSAAFIIEEGFPIEELRRIAHAMAMAAEKAGVEVATGDTKVVGRGQADGCFVITTGVGRTQWTASQPQVGDAVVVSGPIGDHGITVLAARGDLGLEVDVVSDTRYIGPEVTALLSAVPETRLLRDATRGGVATVINEFAEAHDVGFELREGDVPVRPSVAAAGELLGIDPMYVACEGTFVAVVPAGAAATAVAALGPGAAAIGTVVAEARVVLRTALGGRRIVDMLAGAPLPRIC